MTLQFESSTQPENRMKVWKNFCKRLTKHGGDMLASTEAKISPGR